MPITQQTVLYILLAISFNFFYDFLLGAKLVVILKHLGEKISYIHAFYIFCIAKFSSIFTPFFSGIIISKPLVCKHYGNVPIKKGIFITVFEQILDFATILIIFPFLLLVVGHYFFNFYLQILLLCAVFVLFIFLFIYYEHIFNFIWKFKNLIPKKLRIFGRKYNITKEGAFHYFKEVKGLFTNKKLLLAVFPYLLLQILLVPFVLKFSILILGVNLSYLTSFMVYFISVTIGKLSGLPGGLGSADITMGGLLILFGLTSLQATTAVILFRLISLAPALIIGGYLTIYLSTKYSLKFIASSKKPETETHKPKN